MDGHRPWVGCVPEVDEHRGRVGVERVEARIERGLVDVVAARHQRVERDRGARARVHAHDMFDVHPALALGLLELGALLRLIADRDPRPRLLHDIGDLLGRVRRVDRRRHPAAGHDRLLADDPLHAVVADERDGVARLVAEGDEAPGRAADVRPELAPRPMAPLALDPPEDRGFVDARRAQSASWWTRVWRGEVVVMVARLEVQSHRPTRRRGGGGEAWPMQTVPAMTRARQRCDTRLPALTAW